MNEPGLFAKHPVPGRVKTRLAKSLGDEPAADLYTAFLTDLTNRFSTIGDRRLIGFAPDEIAARDYFGELAGNSYELWAQPERDLGTRMASFFREAFKPASDAADTHAVLIGSDSPTLHASYVGEAFDQLKSHDCVIGPASERHFST